MANDPNYSARRGLLGTLWGWVDGARRLLLNLLFLLLVLLVAVFWFKSGPPKLQDKTVLVLDLAGPLVEQQPTGAIHPAPQRAQQAPTGAVVRIVGHAGAPGMAGFCGVTVPKRPHRPGRLGRGAGRLGPSQTLPAVSRRVSAAAFQVPRFRDRKSVV